MMQIVIRIRFRSLRIPDSHGSILELSLHYFRDFLAIHVALLAIRRIVLRQHAGLRVLQAMNRPNLLASLGPFLVD